MMLRVNKSQGALEYILLLVCLFTVMFYAIRPADNPWGRNTGPLRGAFEGFFDDLAKEMDCTINGEPLSDDGIITPWALMYWLHCLGRN